MTKRTHVMRDAGHPWDGRSGFDLLFVDADTQIELDQLVLAANKKHWHDWLIGQDEATGKPGGVMYKPSGLSRPWRDVPGTAVMVV